MEHKKKKLKNKLFRPVVIIYGVSFFLLSIILLFVLVEQNRKSIDSKNNITTQLFAENIEQDILIGAYSEVLRKCNRLITIEGIKYITVETPGGKTICGLGEKGDSNLKEFKIYFSNIRTKDSIASLITIGFKSNTLFQQIIKILIIVVSVSILMILLLSYLLSKILNSVLSPIMEWIKSLKEQSFTNTKIVTDTEEIDFLYKAFSQVLIQNETFQRSVERYELSRQISHDIRSPLEALKSVTNNLGSLDHSTKQIVSNSIGRISDIANGLLKAGKDCDKERELENFRILIEDTLADKKNEYAIEIESVVELDYENAFILGNESRLYRSISNLVNNAVEAQTEKVEIKLFSKKSNVILIIKDHGKGMSSELVEKALTGGVTTKEKGNGLGLSFSKKTIEEHHGKLDVQSTEGAGTEIIITLPSVGAPEWFVGDIKINNSADVIVCIDDDPSFLELYKEKLKNVGKAIQTYSEKEIGSALLPENAKYFIDYDLGNNQTGLEFVIRKGITKNVTLITSMHEDQRIQEVCNEHEIKILPKQIFNNAKIILTDDLEELPESNRQTRVLIDDDELIHMSWQMEAKKESVELRCFFTIDEFLESQDSFSKDAKIYVDSNLADGIKGEVESEKIYKAGFKNIYLATGYSASDVDKPEWIIDIVGKRADFKS